MTLKLIALAILTPILFAASISHADVRPQYSVTGTSATVNAFYHDMIECNLATEDAQDQASQKCYAQGGSGNWVYASYSDCHNRLFGGKSIRMTFYCE
jgi:hypothetical protein